MRAWLTRVLGKHPYTLAGLRGGGATFAYLETENVQWVQRRGRWQSPKSLDHYLGASAALLSTATWSDDAEERVAVLARACPSFLSRA